MKYAADFRAIARDALRGKWPIAVLTGFIASLLGAGIASAVVAQVQVIIVIPQIIYFMRFRQRSFGANFVDHKDANLSDLFSQFHRLGDGFCMNFLVGLFTFLWSLLFGIPGIIKTYSYAISRSCIRSIL